MKTKLLLNIHVFTFFFLKIATKIAVFAVKLHRMIGMTKMSMEKVNFPVCSHGTYINSARTCEGKEVLIGLEQKTDIKYCLRSEQIP